MRELLLLRAPADEVAGAAWSMALWGMWVAPLAVRPINGAGEEWTVAIPDADGPGNAMLGAAAALTVTKVGPALALWWSDRASGMTVVARGKVSTTHVWGADADVIDALGLDETAVVGFEEESLSWALKGDAAIVAGLLAIPAVAPVVRAVLRRPAAGRDNLAELLEVLGAPTSVLDLAVQAREGTPARCVTNLPGAVHIPRASLVGALWRSATYVGPQSPRWMRWYDALRRAKPWRWRVFIVALGFAQLAAAARMALRWDDGEGVWWLLWAAVLGPTGLGNVIAGCTPARSASVGPAATTGRNRP